MTARYRVRRRDFQFISGVGVWCPKSQAKATLLTTVDVDTGYVGVLMVTGKSPDNFMVRSIAVYVDKVRAEKTKLRYDNEVAMRQLADRIASFRHPRSSILKPISRAEHQSVGGVEREHQSIQVAARALRTDIRGRTGEDIIPGHELFPWILRHSAWVHNRFLPHSNNGGTTQEFRTGTCCKSPLLPFVETCMIRVPIDPPGQRRKLDMQMDERNLAWETRRNRWPCGAHSARYGHWTNGAKVGQTPSNSAGTGGKNPRVES